MKKQNSIIHSILVLLLTLVISYSSYAQFSFTSYKTSYFKEFWDNETVVALTGIKEIDDKIVDAVEEYWRHTGFEFVNLEDLTEIDEKEGTNIIAPYGYTIDQVFTTRGWAVYTSGVDINRSRLTNVLAYIPVDFGIKGKKTLGTEKYLKDQVYKMDIIIKSLSDIIQFVYDENYKPTLAHVSGVNKYVKEYNKQFFNPNDLRGKTLLISQTSLSKKFTLEDLQSVYTGSIKVVSKAEFAEIVESADDNYVAVISSFLPNRAMCLFDFESNRIIYIDLNFGKSTADHKKSQFKF